jgi:uncharacterized protein (TIGR03067 family)
MPLLHLMLAVVLAAPAAKDGKKDAPPIVGEWAAESAVANGKPDNPPPGTTWTFTADGKSILTIGGVIGSTESKYTTDAKKDPPWIDVEQGPKGAPFKGIYKVDGDTLTLCVDATVGERPTKFVSSAGSKALLITLKRVKKKE